ncbi:MAG TPA: ABC transporter substrate-binding protein, partial [Candidatus Saccharimonadia bacterium]|nr:ABC transporter substrate-binding protein [Candidatus Saccharimonadia bacterium]
MWYSAVGFVVTLTLSLLVVPLTAEAQQATQVHRIGRLSSGSPTEPNPALEAFRQGLRELGYIEGQNIVIEYRYAEGRDDRLTDLAAELVRLKMEVIVAGGSPAIRAAQHATHTIPIVMAAPPDAVAEGFVASLAHPGGNTTGLSLLSAELPGKRLEILKETVPQSTRVAILANPAAASYTPYLNNLTAAAGALRLHQRVVELRRPNEVDAAFAAMQGAGVDALIVVADPALMDSIRGRVTDLAATYRLPAMYAWKMYVDAGGLMSYGPSLPDLFRRAATYVDKIL